MARKIPVSTDNSGGFIFGNKSKKGELLKLPNGNFVFGREGRNSFPMKMSRRDAVMVGSAMTSGKFGSNNFDRVAARMSKKGISFGSDLRTGARTIHRSGPTRGGAASAAAGSSGGS